MTFGERLKQLRISRYLTQQKLANDLKISQSAIASYEIGAREPKNFEQIKKIAAYFGVPASSMIPMDDSADMEFAQQVADSMRSNQRLAELFKYTRDMTDQELDAVLTVARALASSHNG